MEKIEFICQVRELKSKTLASGDRGFTLILQGEDANMLITGGLTGEQLVRVTVTPEDANRG